MITTYGRVYGSLVLAGHWAISADDNPDKLPVVPTKYVEEALEYIDYSLHHDTEEETPTIADRVAALEEDNTMFNDLILQLFE
jgi:hypothetical protein